ncbi:MAG TPA: integrase arm-type DNA-binding domain-containing protein [Vitreimonas sp.]|uniref:tyrosine-type recombinase/integrase n=1 Tax=Vitreimonas sp. TaxID=3069702 RepID=UPI002D5E1CE7|nr:integrase arm-type DNA-binding domain-containing protein [Vitreimonas sp.]HYD86795.1 integrase arm-type DNA-binding domain-containing protein [Vitreimonas sp.]
MARGKHLLTAAEVSAARPPAMLHDGGGLYLKVEPGAEPQGVAQRSWLLRYTAPATSKRRWMGLGSADAVTLKQARTAADAARKQLEAGLDPIDQRRLEKAAAAVEAEHARTFKQAALEYLETKRAGWGEKHAKLWLAAMDKYAFRLIGALPVAAFDTSRIGVGNIKRVLSPIWSEKPETARRLRQRLESVLEYAAAHGYREGDNPARLARVEHILGKSSRAVEHRPALPFAEVGAFMADLRKLDGLGALALELTVLCATRTTETLGARKAEFDLEAALWVIPAERMKGRNGERREHRIPLSWQAAALLRRVFAAHPKSPFVFPGLGTDSHLSGMAMLKVLERMGRDTITTHGFRSTFRDWAADATDFPRELAEQALAHKLPDKVEAAYRRGDALEKRAKLMQAWADYCDRAAAGGAVVQLRVKSGAA